MLHNGQVSYRATDLVIKGRGMDFEFTRRYLSHRKERSFLGVGWDYSYNTHLEFPYGYTIPGNANSGVNDNTVIVRNGNGRFDRFKRQGTGPFYDQPHGIFSKLKVIVQDQVYTLRTRTGIKYEYHVYDWGKPVGRLASITDRHGNTMQFLYGIAKPWKLRKVIDTLGREIVFKYHTSNTPNTTRLKSITGPYGQSVAYYSDASGLSLGQVHSVAMNADCELLSTVNLEPRVEQYTYANAINVYGQHGYTLLKEVWKPRDVDSGTSVPTLVFAYGNPSPGVYSGPNGDWCWRQTGMGGYIEYTYYLWVSEEVEGLLDPADTQTIVLETLVEDKVGNFAHYFFNQYANLIHKSELIKEGSAEFTDDDIPHPKDINGQYHDGLEAFTTLMKYNKDGQLTWISYPGSSALSGRIEEDRSYIGGNLTQIDTVGRDGTVKTVTYSYEPVYNHLCKSTDRRGYSTYYYCDYMEGTRQLGHVDDIVPAVQAELMLSTRQEAEALLANVPFAGLAGPGVSDDVNGDGIVTHVRGDIIMIEEPIVSLALNGATPQLLDEGGASQEAVTTHTYNNHGQRTSTTDAEENLTFYVYHPEGDPDGNGSPGGQSGTGGWLAQTIVDAQFPHPQEASLGLRALTTDIGRNSGHFQLEARKTTDWFYNERGYLTRQIDERGVEYLFFRNKVDEVIREQRATSVAMVGSRLGGCSEVAESLTAFNYETVYCIDKNGMVYHHHTENVGNLPDGGANPGYIDVDIVYNTRDLPVTTKWEYADGDSDHYVEHYEYDGNSNLTKKTEVVAGMDDLVTRFEYTSRDQPRATIKELSGVGDLVWTKAYTTSGALDQECDPVVGGAANCIDYDYDEFDRVSVAYTPSGHGASFEYDSDDNLLKKRVTQAGYTFPPVVTIPDLANNEILESTSYHYDERSRLVQVDFEDVEGLGSLAEGSLYPDGHVNARIDYDRLSRPTYRIEDDAQVYANRYDGGSRLVKTIDPLGNTVTNCYDDNDNLVKITETDVYPDASTRSFDTFYVYDSLDRPVSVTDQSGHTTRYEYDSRDNVVATTDANGPAGGGTINGLAVNQAGNRIEYNHDGLDRLVETRRIVTPTAHHGSAITTKQEWFENGLLKKRVDDNDNATVYAYDSLGRMTRETLADQSYTDYEYRHDGLVEFTRHMPPSGGGFDVEIENIYNENKWLIEVKDISTAGHVGTESLHFAHDGLGRVIWSMDDVDGTGGEDWIVTRTYDYLSRMLTEDQNGRAVDNEWREEAKRTTLHYPAQSGTFSVHFDHDALDRLDCIRDRSMAVIAQYRYAGSGRVLERHHPQNGTTMRYHDGSWDDALYYDDSRRPTRVDHALGATVQTRLEHGYDRMFNRTYEGRGINGGGVTEGDNYGYDELYRLTTFERDVPAADLGNLGQGQQGELRQYEIDGVQNWQKLIVDGQATTIQANSVNEYTDFGADQPTYDGRGNMITSGGAPNITYRYDFLNRLREVEDVGASKKLEYVYDAHGRRVAVRRTGATPIPEIPDNTEFVYDGIQVIEERAVMQGGLARRFVMGRSLDEPVRMDVDDFYPNVGQSYYYQQSTQGNVVALSDSSGPIVERLTYDAYGMPQFADAQGAVQPVSSSAVANPYLFTARRFEGKVDQLYYYRARFYRPGMGRFCTRDPIGLWGDRSNVGNGYCYVGNRPANTGDPLGLHGVELMVGTEAYDAWMEESAARAGSVVREPASQGSDTTLVGDAFVFAGVATLGAFDSLTEGFVLSDSVRSEAKASSAGFAVGAGAATAVTLAKKVGVKAITGLAKLGGRVFSRAGRKAAKEVTKEGAEEAAKEAGECAAKGGGRGANKLKPDPNATGPHSTWKTDGNGNVTGHAQWDANGNPVQRTDVTGRSHGGVNTPHTHEYGPPNTNPNTGQTYPGNEVNVRPATPGEIPKPGGG